MKNYMDKGRLVIIALLLSILVNIPRASFILGDRQAHRTMVFDGSDIALQIIFGFIFAGLILYLNTFRNWTLVQKVVIFSLIYIATTVIFIQTHWRILGTNETLMPFRLGYYTRHFFLLLSSILVSNFLRDQFQKQTLMLRNERLENEKLKAELNTLRQQLNPHFLFNALNSLSSLMREDVAKSQIFLANLSILLRFSLDFQKKDLVTLAEEGHLLEAYTYLLKIRFGDRLILSLPDFQDKKGKIPPMALQLLIENAVNHNEISSKKPLEINIEMTDNMHSIMVSNNINLKPSNTEGLGLGLYNLNTRYMLLSQKEISISDENGIFKVMIPIL
jgi:two-component system, LytTR family, sensor kinase